MQLPNHYIQQTHKQKEKDKAGHSRPFCLFLNPARVLFDLQSCFFHVLPCEVGNAVMSCGNFPFIKCHPKDFWNAHTHSDMDVCGLFQVKKYFQKGLHLYCTLLTHTFLGFLPTILRFIHQLGDCLLRYHLLIRWRNHIH